ncbi:MAG: hypothetical protein C4524_11745 [Candidatus Zixiibacteriota bacterium]|nr:MAG: hypothetical protein C4524_11745 [candidate division Zixibacteria bacterium]
MRQQGVESVTILYRRTREEMPAFEEEIEAALEEGITLETLVTPVQVLSQDGTLTGVECVRNRLGELDSSGRRKPVPSPGSEFTLNLDTLIVAISESPDTDSIARDGDRCVSIRDDGTVTVDTDTLACCRPGVFAGGDVTTGPNTVVDAIAAGKKAAVMIDRYLKGEELHPPAEVRRPRHYIEPSNLSEEELARIRRAEPPRVPPEVRRRSFAEVEMSLSVHDATTEARRCLRCDLDFTHHMKPESSPAETSEGKRI